MKKHERYHGLRKAWICFFVGCDGSTLGYENHLQNMGVSTLQKEGSSTNGDEGSVWVPDWGALLFHNRHLQDGVWQLLKKCKVCRTGLVSSMGITEKTEPLEGSGMVQSAGIDEKGAGAPARVGDFDGSRDGEVLVSEQERIQEVLSAGLSELNDLFAA